VGSHLKPGRSRFAWELVRYVLAWALVVSAVVGLFWLLQEVLPDIVSSEATTTTTTTEAPTASSTSTVPTTSTTLPASTTTSEAAEPTTTTSTTPAARPPEELTVTVLNSTTRVGLAAEVAADLADLGYLVGQPANATPQRAVTTILHAEGFGLEAIELKETAFEEEATVGLDDEGRTSGEADIVVILGDSYP
jgi:cytoskeletal protein RodZ